MNGGPNLDGGSSFSVKNAKFFIKVCQATYDFSDTRINSLFGDADSLSRFAGPLDSHALVAAVDGVAVLAFRGTFPLSIENMLTDENIALTPAPIGDGRVHRGFADAFRILMPQIRQALADPAIENLWVTGHSLGGALATLAAIELEARSSFRGLYTFGSPRVGDPEFADHFQPLYFRVVNNRDIVTQVPAKGEFYKHVGTREHLQPGVPIEESAPGDDADDSVVSKALAPQVSGFQDGLLSSSQFVNGLADRLLPGVELPRDPLGILASVETAIESTIGLDELLSRLGIAKNQVLARAPFDVIEQRADQFCRVVRGSLCDHFPLSYISALEASA